MKEVNEWDDNPRDMLVWNDDENFKATKFVVFIEPSSRVYPYTRVITWDASTGDLNWCKHCAEVESHSPRLMTHKELSRWLREKPDREVKHNGVVFSTHNYEVNKEDDPVDNYFYVREGDAPWVVPFKEGL